MSAISPPANGDRSDKSDEDLIEAYSSGDRESMGVLYDRYHLRLVQRMNAACGNWHTAEEVAIETWHNIMARSKTFVDKGSGSFARWLSRVVYNTRISLWRGSRHQDDQFSSDDEHLSSLPSVVDSSDPVLAALRQEQRERVRAALDNLGPICRCAVVLYYFEEIAGDEIAEILEISTQAVYSRLYAARKKLLSSLKDIGPEAQ